MLNLMTPEQLENWQKIKTHLESVGSTENDYYTRACAICSGGKDPASIPQPIDFITDQES